MIDLPAHVAHGTRYAYIYYDCTCDACKAANAAYFRRYLAPRDVGDAEHGTREAFEAHNCRCSPCRKAHAAYRKDRRALAPASIETKPAKLLRKAGWQKLHRTSLNGRHVVFWRHPDQRYSYARVRQEDALAIVRGEMRIEDKVEPSCAA